MDIFISWSGPRSHAVASALHNWLPKIVNAFKPWLSSVDLDKGARWSSDVAGRLEQSKAGIICVTPGNLHADWLLFEAGALSKQVASTFVCPLLIGLEPSDVKGPIAQFQATRLVKDDVLKLIKTLNTALGDVALAETHVKDMFEMCWPKIEADLKNLPDEHAAGERRPRSERDFLEEILGILRAQQRSSQSHALKVVSDALNAQRTSVLEAQRSKLWVENVGDLIHRAAKTLDPTLSKSSVTHGDGTLYVELESSRGKTYKLELPRDLPVELLQTVLLAELAKLLAIEKSSDS
jgi:hypothetical protein